VHFESLKNFAIQAISLFAYLAEHGFYFDEIHPSMFRVSKN